MAAEEERDLYFKQRDAFSEAVRNAVDAQIAPALFSEEKIIDMGLPYHTPWDHYNNSALITGEEPFASQFFGYKPQVFITDPFVTKEQLDAAPKTVHVEFEGKSHDIPLRLEQHPMIKRGVDPKEWKEELERQYVVREALDRLEKSLKKSFNLVSGKDYNFSYSVARKSETHLDIQLFPRDAILEKFNPVSRRGVPRTLEGAVVKHIERSLKAFKPEQGFKVELSHGRIVAY